MLIILLYSSKSLTHEANLFYTFRYNSFYEAILSFFSWKKTSCNFFIDKITN